MVKGYGVNPGQRVIALGNIVSYTLTGEDCDRIMRRRERCSPVFGGLPVSQGEVRPAMVLAIWSCPTGVKLDLSVQLNGEDTYWARDVPFSHDDPSGGRPGAWHWPAERFQYTP